MIDFLIEGGLVFTLPMTLIFFINIALGVRCYIFLNANRFKDTFDAQKAISTVKYVATIVLTLGILGQVIGLYEAFKVISQGNFEITPQLMAGGIRVSSITTILGLSYFIVSYAIFLILNLRLKQSRLKPNK